jgi:hypothetical protein
LAKGWEWWCTPVIPAGGRLRQEDFEFKDSLGKIEVPHLKFLLKFELN